MSDSTYASSYKKIIAYLDKFRIGSAIKALRDFIISADETKELPRLEKLKETYGYMLHYFVEGFDDNMRDSIYWQLRTDLYSLADRVLIQHFRPSDPSLFYSTSRIVKMRGQTLNNLIEKYRNDNGTMLLISESGSYDTDFAKAHELLLSDIFETLWVNQAISDTDRELLFETISCQSSPDELKTILMFSSLLGALKFYDRNKLLLFIDLYDRLNETDETITAHSLVAMILIFLKWPERIRGDSIIETRIGLWSDSLIHYTRIKEVAINLIRTRDTDRISEKMKNEVIPELMKIHPKILKRLKESSLETDMQDLEQNPEWEELLNKSGLADKMKELSELQSEGGDVMMMAFSNLKKFPFFNRISNWFLPFSILHSEMPEFIRSDSGNITTLLNLGGMLCDSDKYSFMLSIAAMPESNRNIALGNLQNQFSRLNEEITSSIANHTKSNFNRTVTNSIRNLYRFMKLFRLHDEFEDPFAKPFNFISLPYLGEIVNSEEFISLIAEFYFKRGYYSDALPMLRKLSSENHVTPHLYEKIGYCLQMAGDNIPAIEAYDKALLFNPESEWLMRKLAYNHKVCGDFQKALHYYCRLYEKHDEDTALIMNIANAYFEIGKTTEALQFYYKAAYLSPANRNAIRAIAWCEFLNGNYEKSKLYYEKLFGESVSPAFSDFINYSYLCIATLLYKKALELLKSAMSLDKRNFNSIIDAFEEDKAILEEKGIGRRDLNMILDKLSLDEP